MNDCSNQPQQLNGEFTPQEKASYITWKMIQGQEFTVAEVAECFNMTWHGANRLLGTISRVIPIAPNSTGIWQRFDNM